MLPAHTGFLGCSAAWRKEKKPRQRDIMVWGTQRSRWPRLRGVVSQRRQQRGILGAPVPSWALPGGISETRVLLGAAAPVTALWGSWSDTQSACVTSSPSSSSCPRVLPAKSRAEMHLCKPGCKRG